MRSGTFASRRRGGALGLALLLCALFAPAAGAVTINVDTPGPYFRGTTISVSAAGIPGCWTGTTTYAWSFDGGNPATDTSGPSSSVSFASLGSHGLHLTATPGGVDLISDPACPAFQMAPDASVTVDNQSPVNLTAGGSPNPATVGGSVAFSASASDPDGDTLSYSWDFGDGNSATGAGPHHTYGAAGSYPVTVTVSDAHGGTAFFSFSQAVGNVNHAPNAPTISPNNAVVGRLVPVTFTAPTTDPDGDPVTYSWNFGDGTSDTGPSVTHAYSLPGPGNTAYLVRVTVSDGSLTSTDTTLVTVSSRNPPTPSFTVSPASPSAGQIVTLTSTSTPGDAPISGYAWDLDGDGQYDDASGSTAQTSFGAAGTYTVRLQTTDANFPDAASAPKTFQRIIVGPAPPAPPATTPVTPPTPALAAQSVAKAAKLFPFPLVRIAGDVFGTGVRLTLLSVRAPSGSRIKVVCKGKGCPNKAYTVFIPRGKGSLRIKRMQRILARNAHVEVFVTKGGLIGKYTRFRIRTGKAPSRLDACLSPGAVKPVACSSV